MTTGLWSQDEHDKFLHAIKLYPSGPWRKVAEFVGTRSIRQVQTHAQKYHEKVVRRMRGLHKGRKASSGRNEHRIDDDLLEACRVGQGFGVIAPYQTKPLARPIRSRATSMPVLSVVGDLSPGSLDTDAVMAMISAFRSTLPGDDGDLPTLEESLDFLINHLSGNPHGGESGMEIVF